MPIRITDTCRHCGTAVQPTEPMGAWTHAGLSIYCPGSAQKFTAAPVIVTEPRRKP